MDKTAMPDNFFYGTPTIDATAFIASGAVVTGSVTLGAYSSIWYTAVLRGDINKICVGDYSNIQDGCVLHVENDRACIVGSHVTVGHRAILHGCTIEDGALIGMGAIVLNGAVVKRGAMVAAGAVVKENTIIEENSLYAGVPAIFIKTLGESNFDTNLRWAEKYTKLAQIHRLNT